MRRGPTGRWPRRARSKLEKSIPILEKEVSCRFCDDHRLRLLAFSFEIFIGGFNGHGRDEVSKMKNRQYFFRTETRRDEDDGLLEIPKGAKRDESALEFMQNIGWVNKP